MGTAHAKRCQDDASSSKPRFNSHFSPARERPYSGPPIEYHFVDCQVTVRPQSDGYSRTPSLSSEDEGHYILLEHPYTFGFRLMHFTKVPGGLQRTGHLGNAVLISFQGIFCRNPVSSNNGSCLELRVEKAWLQASRVHSGILTRTTQHIIHMVNVEESINRAAQSGERLLCVAMTGQEDCRQANGTNGDLTSVMRVDLFFEMTSQLASEQYTYSIALVPCKVSYRNHVLFRPVPYVQCDWCGTLKHHLDQGWRLVDIYIDIPTVSQFFDPKSQDFTPTTMNALWFFEKPVSRIEDNTARFEGKVIEHAVTAKSHTMGSSAVPSWEHMMQDMGKRGWELACVIETHSMESVGLTEVLLKSLLFFQRPIIKRFTSPSLTKSRASVSD